MKKIFTLSLTLLLSITMFSQKIVPNNGYTRIESQAEKDFAKNYVSPLRETNPPTGEVRNIAEWEPMERVFISYVDGFGVPYELIKQISEYSVATIFVDNESQENYVKGLLSSNGVNMENCTFIRFGTDAWWSRDYSPWCISLDNNKVAVMDFKYNRPARVHDDSVPIVVSQTYAMEYYKMGVTLTGGNYMTDGYGISASTDLVNEENSISEDEIKTKVKDYLGVNTYHMMPDPQDDYIKHIDCWGKFLDVDKVAVTQVPESDYRYAAYEAAASYFKNNNCSFGYPYKVYRLQSEAYGASLTNPYTNSLILNGKVFVPQTGSSLDDEALAVYTEAMPGYEIIGVTATSAPWFNTDALHCRTHGLADRKMTFIKHIPFQDTLTTEEDITISAEVYTYSDTKLRAEPKLFYKIDDTDYESIILTKTTGNTYTANIPVSAGMKKILYYISAENTEGKIFSVPIMKENAPYVINLKTTVGGIDNQITTQERMKIYPNPSKGMFYVDINTTQDVKIDIISTNGQQVYSGVEHINSNYPLLFNLDLEAGIYILYAKTDKTTFKSKLIIRK